MKRQLRKTLFFSFIFLLALFSGIFAQQRGAVTYVPDEIIVKLKGTAKDTRDHIAAQVGVVKVAALFKEPPRKALSKRATPGPGTILKLSLKQNSDVEAAVHQYQSNPQVEYAQPNYIHQIHFIPNDPDYKKQWALQKIGLEQAWEYHQGSQDVLIAIIDTGIDYEHEDLKDNLWINPGEDLNGNGQVDATDFNGLDDDGNGFVDDIRGWDFTDAPHFPDGGDYLTQDNDPMDEHGHGTSVAGIVGAVANNGIGIAGLAFGCQIMNLRAGTSRGLLEEDDVVSAIVYAVDNGARVINMSFGDVVASPLLRDIMGYAHGQNCVLVASAGNSSTDQIHYPSSFSETISVGATDSQDFLASFSNYGSTMDVVAPGVDILTTKMGGQYQTFGGTSASAPFVSGLAALLLSQNPALSNEEVKGIIVGSADDLGEPGWDSYYAAGRINALQALQVENFLLAEITFPRMDQGFDGGILTIVGTAAGALLASYSLAFGTGDNPQHWQEIAHVENRQVVKDSLCTWNVSGLKDTSYTLRLKLFNKDGSSAEDRIRVFIDHSPPVISYMKQTEMLDGYRYSVLLEFNTDDLCEASVFYRPSGSNGSFHELPLEYQTHEHRINITQDLAPGKNEYFIRAVNRAGLISEDTNEGHYYLLDLSQPPINTSDFVQLNQTLPASYLLNKISDFDGDGKWEIILNQYDDRLSFHLMKIYEYSPEGFTEVFSSSGVAIPRDRGDSDGDGKLEILASAGPVSFIYESPSPGAFPNRIVWADSNDCWASRFTDLDADGKGEIIARVQNTFTIWECIGDNTYSLIDSLPNPTRGSNITGVPHSEIADFDGDGRQEILLGDYDGDIYIYEAQGNNLFAHTWSDSLPLMDTIDFLSHGDYDGDGVAEFVVGCHSDPKLDLEHEYDSRHWLYRVYDMTGDNSYIPVWQEEFFGFQPPQDFDSGVSSGDIDGDGRDEILINVFPDFYIIDSDPATGQFSPVWYYTPNRSNQVVIGDLDGNGIQEFYFNDGTEVIAFEHLSQSSGPATPLGLEAQLLDTNRVQLLWREVQNADGYFLYRSTRSEALIQWAWATQTHFVDSTVLKDTTYWYAVTSVDTSLTPQESRLSKPIEVRPSDRPYLVSARYVLSRQIRVRFSEPMNQSVRNPSNYLVSPELGHPSFGRLINNWSRPSSVAFDNNGREVVLTMPDDFSQPGRYYVSVENVRDVEGMPIDTTRNSMVFEVAFAPQPPYLVRASLERGPSIRLEFSQPLDVVSATDGSHYRIEPNIVLTEARLDETNNRNVYLILDKKSPIGAFGVNYIITVSQVKNSAGVAIQPGRGDKASLIFSQPDLSQVITFPNPYRPDSGADGITFANLTSEATIKILTLSGKVIKTLREQDGNGGVKWDLRDDTGNEVSSGIYLYYVTGNGDSRVGKFAVVR